MPRILTVRPVVLLGVGLLLAAAAVFVLARGPHADAAGTARAVHLSASPAKLAFNKKTLTVRHGKITFIMANPSSLPHGIAVEGHGIDKDGKVVATGRTSRVTVTLRKGTYEFFCPVPAHKAAGMRGKIIVT
ncbi:hypothetical protein FSW04_19170 [Baekduia soli]|uniref:Blue (type 1) copper domain-containing protein n=1 Tax=Baekduia soli TaxID=496014 RepID=A0A5B8U927_9ACTN|nr:plastocyanin/azurin family copper-binding protein [Baekduia soli]QEC49477.1 hypothetical protein FSW04_19170 [Baekduia soli]